MNLRNLRRIHHLFKGGVGLGIPDVVSDADLEEQRLLKDNAELLTQAGEGNIFDVMAIDPYRAFLDIEEPHQKRENRRFAAARWSHKRNGFTGLNVDVHPLDDNLAGIIRKNNVVEINIAANFTLQFQGTRAIKNRRFFVENFKETVC